MDAFAFFVGGVLPYVAVLVFVIGMAYRLRTWWRTKQPGKMTLFPAPPKGSTFRGVLAESLLLPRLFRGDRMLWVIAWVFHATLALVFLGHFRVVTGAVDSVLLSLGMSPAGIDTMSSTTGGAAGILLLVTGVALVLRRLALVRVREISNPADYFALLLVVAVVLTGNVMRFAGHFDLETTRAWAISLVSFAPVVPASGAFLAHLLLASVLIIYIPCSKILHLGGIFFTQALVQGR